MHGGLTETLHRLAATAKREGRTALTEPEGLEIVQALGLGVPHYVVLPGPEALVDVDLDAFQSDEVVLKVVSPDVLHKSDVGGVAFLTKDRAEIQKALEAMHGRFAGTDVRGYLLAAFVPHDPSLGGQLLLGLRYTAEFGPVVTFGSGGVHAEFLARNLKPGRDSAILSPSLASPAGIEAALEQTAVTPAATGQLRGQASHVTLEDLRDLVGRLLAFAAENIPDPLDEFEINPLVFSPGGPVALDALVKLGDAPPPPESPRPLEKIHHLLEPRHIAILGVSKSMNPGHRILLNVIRQGFPKDQITIVKPGCDTFQGCRCVPDLPSLEGRVDLLVVCVEAEQVPAIVEDVVRGERAESLILIAGGLGERRGSEVHVEKIRETIRRSRETSWRGPILNGGNCLGVRSIPGHFDTLFIPEHKLHYPEGPSAPLALISQSGAFAVSRASRLSALNPRMIITLGNQLDLTVADYLAYLQDQSELEVFACYVEGFRPLDGTRWLEACRKITDSGRAVILYRAGRTSAGQDATASHTASIAGDYAVTRALAHAAGAVVADTLDDFDDLVRLFTFLHDKDVSGWRLGALSNAGFEIVAMADNLGPFQLATFQDETRNKLQQLLERRRLDSIVGVKNLLDLTPIVDDEAYGEAVRLVLGDANVDVGVVGCVPLTGALQTVAAGEGYAEDLTAEGSIVQRLVRFFHESDKAWVGVVDAGPLYDPMAEHLLAEGIPTFRSADRALRLFGRYVAWRLAHADLRGGRR